MELMIMVVIFPEVLSILLLFSKGGWMLRGGATFRLGRYAETARPNMEQWHVIGWQERGRLVTSYQTE